MVQVIGIQDQCDAFVDLYFVWNLICRRCLEAVMACQLHLAAESCSSSSSSSRRALLPAAGSSAVQDTKTSTLML